jgi:hypothetical protein
VRRWRRLVLRLLIVAAWLALAAAVSIGAELTAAEAWIAAVSGSFCYLSMEYQRDRNNALLALVRKWNPVIEQWKEAARPEARACQTGCGPCYPGRAADHPRDSGGAG